MVVRVIQPEYVGTASGKRAYDPLAVAPHRPTVVLDRLAHLFSSPSLLGEVSPGSYWRGVAMSWPRPSPATIAAPLDGAFRNAIIECCGDAECIAVMASGGIDSLAVLVTVCRLFPDRRVIALCADVVDDRGVSTVEVLRSLICSFRIRCTLAPVNCSEWREWPKWSPHGPARTAVPQAHAAIARLAREEGAEVLLSGDGADELVAVHRYAARAIARLSGLKTALRYCLDTGKTGPGLAGEVLALIADNLPARSRLQAYWAVNWPEWCTPKACAALTPPFYTSARAWASTWITETLESHTVNNLTWAEAEALDAWWPQPYLAPASDLPEASPYLHEDFVASALAYPLAKRYARAAHPYHRIKAGIVGLFPLDERKYLPSTKQYFTKFAAEVQPDIDISLGIDVGLFDARRIESQDPQTKMLIASTEHWLRGAIASGAAIDAHVPFRRNEACRSL